MTDSLPDPSQSPPTAFPLEGRLASVDFGTVRIGIAICDPLRILVSPWEVRAVAGPEADGAYFNELARRERIDGWVVGLPIHCDGGESEKSRQSRTFAKWLAETTKIPVRLFDERFTTSAAQQRMRAMGKTKRSRVRNLDAIAAQVLLEAFLEACRYRGNIAGFPVDAPATGDQPLD